MNAGFTSQKGGKIENTCNDPTNNKFYYKMDFENKTTTEKYDVYFVYHNDGINESTATEVANEEKIKCNSVIKTITIDPDKTFYIFRKYKYVIGYNEYKIYKDSDMGTLVSKSKFLEIKEPILEINMIHKNGDNNNKKFYIRFNSIKESVLSSNIESLTDQKDKIDTSNIDKLKTYFEKLIKKPAPTSAATTEPDATTTAAASAATQSPAAKAAEAAEPSDAQSSPPSITAPKVLSTKVFQQDDPDAMKKKKDGGQYKQIPRIKNAVVNNIIKRLILIGSIRNKKKRATPSAKTKALPAKAKAKTKAKALPAKEKSRDKK